MDFVEFIGSCLPGDVGKRKSRDGKAAGRIGGDEAATKFVDVAKAVAVEVAVRRLRRRL